MIRLSANVMYQSSRMLSLIDDFCFNNMYELKNAINYSIDSLDIFDFICECGWASIDNNVPILSKRGKEINKLKNQAYYDEKMKLMLKDYITIAKPIWAYRIPYGRKEASTFMTKDELSCFNEANLLSDDPNLSAVDWWDDISSLFRGDINLKMLQIGRDGEKLTVQFETKRVKRKPIWQSIDSNLSGFDIISTTTEESTDKLFIEVKTTNESIENATFHISENEWNVANKSKYYSFYLWHLNEDVIQLAILSKEDIVQHIPTNNDSGKWESVKIPFRNFKDKFMIINTEDCYE